MATANWIGRASGRGHGVEICASRVSAPVRQVIGAAAVLMTLAHAAYAQQPPLRRHNAFESLNASSPYARTWTSAQAKQGVTGFTFLRNIPGRSNEVIYFDPRGVAYQWMSKRPAVISGTWIVDLRSPRSSDSARVFVCTTFNSYSPAGEPIPNSVVNRCIDPSLFFIPATEHVKGDAFKLAGRTTAPGELPIERMRIEDLKRNSANRR